jgi:hypothetical protein
VRDELELHAARLAGQTLRPLAAARAGEAPLVAAGWKVSLARHYLDTAAEAALLKHGAATGLDAAAQRLFGGGLVNPSEGRPALHWALRAQSALTGEAETGSSLRVAFRRGCFHSPRSRIHRGSPCPCGLRLLRGTRLLRGLFGCQGLVGLCREGVGRRRCPA